jgi:hypothetical protein
MATTAIWAVKGQLGRVVEYVENPEKTLTQETLRDVLDYAAQERKTRQLVTGINCEPQTAQTEMVGLQTHFGKNKGVVAYHGYQSFAEGEVTPEQCHQIGVALARELWGERYQVLVATHIDRANHLHNHFVVNPVSFVDGKRYYRSVQDYALMRETSDRLCREHCLSVVKNSQPGKSKHYGEWRAEQESRPTWRGIVKSDVDAAIAAAQTDRQFFELLRKKGYAIKMGKDISVRPPGKERFVRLTRNFGEDYSIVGIRKQILAHKRQLPTPQKKAPPKIILHCQLRGNWQKRRKINGWRALYMQYLFKMGVLPRKKTPYQKHRKVHFLFREDLLKIRQFDEETRLLWREKIDTPEQLLAFRANYTKKEAKICERISTRAPELRAKLDAVRREEKSNVKELNKYEHLRR